MYTESIQVALICILALIGSFVPAERATIGLLDGIYTRYAEYMTILSAILHCFMIEWGLPTVFLNEEVLSKRNWRLAF